MKNEGFKLVDYGTTEYQALVVNAIHLVSSHADAYVVNPLTNKYFKDLLNFKYTFLQHGITQGDLSKWLNSKNIACFITSANKEYKSITDNHSKYKFSSKEVVLTGFPRHDELLKKNVNNEKMILIMPTWRKSIVGNTKGKGTDRELNDNFVHTKYFKYWNSFLHSKKLLELSRHYGYRLVYFPHTNVQPYLSQFSIPDYIEVLSHHHASMQTLFKKAACMVTDYSSVAFEMAYLEKPVIYYQFDRDEIFGGGHMIEKGYFDYEKDAFGPICDSDKQVFASLKKVLESDSTMSKEYLSRVLKTFKYRDGQCCQRIYDAILNLENLDEPEETRLENLLLN